MWKYEAWINRFRKKTHKIFSPNYGWKTVAVLLFRWNTIQEVVVLCFKVKTLPSWFKEVSPLILCSPSVLVNPPPPPPPLTPSTNHQSLLWKSHVRDVTDIILRGRKFFLWAWKSILIRELLHSAIMISILHVLHIFSF